MSFLRSFFGLNDWTTEQAVCCPFDHLTQSGVPYKESHPSAHVNLEEGLFHCKACGAGHNEQQFIKAVLNCSLATAHKLKQAFSNDEDQLSWSEETELTEEGSSLLTSLGISQAVSHELQLADRQPGAVMFPVFMYGHLIDIRTYTPSAPIKCVSRKGGPNGMVIPFDIWRHTPKDRWTVLCAGEKDMAVARSNGLNAITLTGGEQILPAVLAEFEGRNIAVCYDNDNTGKVGAIKVCTLLKEVAATVKNVTGFHEICSADKEDITDFFVKHGKTREDLIRYIEQTPVFEITDSILHSRYPILNLHQAASPQYVGRLVRSNIQVVATADATFSIPAEILAEKYRMAEDGNTMVNGESREWALDEDRCHDLLHLLDNNFKEPDIDKNIRSILRIPQKERYVKIRKLGKQTVFKAYVTDMFETTTDAIMPIEFTCYSVGLKLESGKKYLATYKLVPHPYKGQQLTMIITGAVQANDSVSKFEVTEKVAEHLSVFVNMPGTVEERMADLTEKVKGVLGYNGNNTLIQAMDLAFHTPLQFHLGTFPDTRAYLDTIIVGESRVGKSSTAEALRRLYNLGTFTSLAGNSATVAGLIGGSNKTSSGGFQTRAGLLPQNHMGLIIFEEFGKCNANIVRELTDIRSSNEVRITRVSGTLKLPAMVRMISLSNVRSTGSEIKPISTYPHGLAVLTELVGTAEDIARYDLMLVLSDRGNTDADPYWRPQEPLPNEVYQARVRWVWSRKPEQIVIEDDVGHYLIARATELNREFDSHIKVFGTEAWKKLARLSIAVAGYLVSTDVTFEKIVVKREHVAFAEQFFRSIYDNPTFRLREFVTYERRYSTIDNDGVHLLQQLYMKAPGLLLQLEQESKTNKNTLMSAAGLENGQYNALMNQMIAGMFVRMTGYDILPTERFRLGMARINRNVSVARLGEINATMGTSQDHCV